MSSITPILLAGGSGTRLWPLSRKTYPKQFTKLSSKRTLFQESALRFLSSDDLKFNAHITITNSLFRFIVKDQLQDIGLDSGLILIEPEAKNTAPAIIAATIFAYKEDQDAIIITAPSDHIIPDTKNFNDLIKIGLNSIENGNIVTFAINPTYPEIGYGYLKLAKSNKPGPKRVLRFIEKPNINSATKMLNEGGYFWNSGIFMFRAKDMIEAFKKNANDILLAVDKAVEKSVLDLEFIRLDPKSWKNIDSISIDYAIMEKSNNLVAVPYSSGWSDLGNWDSVWRETNQDYNGVALSKNAHAIDCKNSLLRSEDSSQHIVGLGLNNIVAVAMPDAVLVANKNKSQDVKAVVEYLNNRNVLQSENFAKYYRPWGWFENLSKGDGFLVKKIFVKPSAALSLQSHKYRSEHWVIVSGSAKVTIDKNVKLVKEGESVFVSVGSLHRLENPGKDTITIIEVQIGSILSEDDIIRYEDNYSRY
jgi:mannose-1-phosphate guanylyltransferase / mannose-6-phosphate isomerase